MDSTEEFFSDKAKMLQLLNNAQKPSLSSLEKSLLESVEESTHGIEEAAVLFSGGIDSGIIAKAIGERVPRTMLFSVGMENSHALDFPAKAAGLLKLPITKISVGRGELSAALNETRKIIPQPSFMQVQIAVPEFIALRAAKRCGFMHVFSGQGADELFFGYDEFRRELEKSSSFEKLEQVRKSRLLNLWGDNLSRDFAIAKHLGLELHAPFLHRAFIKQAIAFPAKENILSAEDFLRKRVLRKLATHLGVPVEIAGRKKKAIQYDSGISKELKKLEFMRGK